MTAPAKPATTTAPVSWDLPAPAPDDAVRWQGGAVPWSPSPLGLLWVVAALILPCDRLLDAPSTLTIVAAVAWAVALPTCWLSWERSRYLRRIRARYRVTDHAVTARAVDPYGASPHMLTSWWYLLLLSNGPVWILSASGFLLLMALLFADSTMTPAPVWTAKLATACGLRSTCSARGRGDIRVLQPGPALLMDQLADVPALRAVIAAGFQGLRDPSAPAPATASSPEPQASPVTDPDPVSPDPDDALPAGECWPGEVVLWRGRHAAAGVMPAAVVLAVASLIVASLMLLPPVTAGIWIPALMIAGFGICGAILLDALRRHRIDGTRYALTDRRLVIRKGRTTEYLRLTALMPRPVVAHGASGIGTITVNLSAWSLDHVPDAAAVHGRITDAIAARRARAGNAW